MSKDFKKAAKECALALITGGLYMVVIFVKILFTTPEGQKLVERQVNTKIKAFKISEKKDTNEPKNQIGFTIK